MGSLQGFIAKRRQDGVKTKTVNTALGVVRRVLNLAASEWMDEQGMTWLATAPKIKLFAVTDARSPYPLTDEVNRPDFPGGSNMREDGAYGNSKAVFNGSTGAGCAAGAGAAG
jgi:hypothetical protein